MKHFPPQHHIQTPAVKHLSPQHPKNDPKSPIFTMQGRTFFHNTHHPHNTHPHPGDFSFTTPRANPHQPTVACNSTPAHPIRKSLGGELHAKLGEPRSDVRQARPRCRWAVAGPGQTTHRHPDRLEAAARPAGPGRATHSDKPRRCGGLRRGLPRCRWAVAGPRHATHRHPNRLEAAARPAGPGRASRSITPSL